MLAHLRVTNLGVLADASLEPGPGLTVITGETGAGKTLLLGGLRLLLGERGEASLVGPHGEETIAEALFTVDDEEAAVSRAVPRKGRSRAHSDGVIVSAQTLGEKVAPLVEIVGQHDQLSLRRSTVLLVFLDAIGGRELGEALAQYREAWEELARLRFEEARLGGDEMALRRELDLARYQAEEIAGAGIRVGLDDELETQASRLRNVVEITGQLAETGRLLEMMSEQAGEAVSRLRKVSDLDPSSARLAAEAEVISESVHELSRELHRVGETLESDPNRLEELEGRLNQIGDLKRKYGRTLEEIVSYGETVGKRAVEIEGLLERSETIGSELERTRRRVVENGEELSTRRRLAADILAERARDHLGDLGLAEATVELRVDLVEPGPSGCDRAELWFSSDRRLQLMPVGSGASGGELSRLVLAVRLASLATSDATLVFDEIDTGIGGATALAMGRKLAELARSTQVLCVTHLPQVAAHADTHYLIAREGAMARAFELSGEDRVREITRMLAGLPESEAASLAASELLATAAGQ